MAESELGDRLVFAAQAKVPVQRADGEQVLLALADAGSAVVKLRAWSKEQQTHKEAWSYPEIMDDLVAQRRTFHDAVGFVGSSMHDALRTARGFVTVSSTAALEAMAMDRPTLIISDFRVSAEMINLVFEGSGCLGTLDDLRRGKLFRPDPDWLEANHFHRPEENDWLEMLARLLAARACGELPGRRRPRFSLPRRVRRRLRLLIPARHWSRLRKLRGGLTARRRNQLVLCRVMCDSSAPGDARQCGPDSAILIR
jgi:hypothetical protein